MTMRSALRLPSARELVGAFLAFVLLAAVWTRPMSLSPADTIVDLLSEGKFTAPWTVAKLLDL